MSLPLDKIVFLLLNRYIVIIYTLQRKYSESNGVIRNKNLSSNINKLVFSKIMAKMIYCKLPNKFYLTLSKNKEKMYVAKLKSDITRQEFRIIPQNAKHT